VLRAALAIGLCLSVRAEAAAPEEPPEAAARPPAASAVPVTPPPPARFAIVVGNNRAHGVETLRYADDDALAMQSLFLDADVDSRLLTTFDDATRELYPLASSAGAPTLAELERELAAVRAAIVASIARGTTTEFYFFYSGHGDVEGGEGRLILEDHALSRGELYDLLKASGATRSHVLLDACSSFLVASKRADEQRREPVDPTFAMSRTPAELDNVGFVLSSSSDRDSHEWARYEAGIVSHELRSGLRGAADADLDGRITYAELAAFMHQANRAIDIPRLRPEPFVAPPGTDFQAPLLSWQPGTESVRVRGGATGHFYVENVRGQRLLDAHPAPGQWVYLHLPGNRPLFIRGHERPAEYELAIWTAPEVTELTPMTSVLVQPKGAEELALNRLFAASFGPDHVAEYERGVASRRRPVSAPLDAESSPWMRPLGYAALTAALAGGALSAAALVTRLDALDASQPDARHANDRIERLHQLSLVPYVTAATTGLMWGWLKFGSSAASPSLTVTPTLTNGRMLFDLEGRF
jgi:hypothetical protein